MLRALLRSAVSNSLKSPCCTLVCNVTVGRAAFVSSQSGGADKSEETISTPSNLSEEEFARRDNLQQEHLRSRQKGDPRREMSPDLHEFIRTVNPVRESTIPTTKPRRLPRHLREDDNSEDDDFDYIDEEGSEVFYEGRQRVQMPLVENLEMPEKIEGFETTRTTNFSRTQDRPTPRLYKDGDVVDLFDLLKKRENDPDTDIDSFVEQVYKEYGERHELPDEKHQAKHKYLLSCALKYIEMPVLMRDTDNMFDGVPRHRASEFRDFYKNVDVPKTTAKFVLEDLSDIKLKGIK
ncbi:hypothetical protein ACA910_018105 [Epithemia clementina (nom. ined.)]